MAKKDVEISDSLHRCFRCRRNASYLKDYYKINSGAYSFLGYVPFCKDCLSEIFIKYTNQFGDMSKAVKKICMLFDLYYSDILFTSCYGDPEKIIGNYIRMLNMANYKDKCFDDSFDTGFRQHTEDVVVEEIIKSEDIEKWGTGLAGDYHALNDHYAFLKNANPNGDNNQEIFIKDLCYIQMQKMKAVRENRIDDFNKLSESYRKTFQQAGLKTIRDASLDNEFSIGVNAEAIEKYSPAEFYLSKKIYYDFDGIEGYFKRFLLRPLKNLMHGMNIRDNEYCVKDDDQ